MPDCPLIVGEHDSGTAIAIGNRQGLGSDEKSDDDSGVSGGGVMFKDSSSTPHPIYWVQHFLIGNDTCVNLPGEGTVVLVRQGGPYADAAVSPQPAAAVEADPVTSTGQVLQTPSWLRLIYCALSTSNSVMRQIQPRFPSHISGEIRRGNRWLTDRKHFA